MKKVALVCAVITMFCIGYTACKHRPEVLPAPIVTGPSGLTYTPATIQVKTGNTISSVKPAISGTQPMTFSLTSSPASAGHITINSQGVISVDSSISPGVYAVTVTVENSVAVNTFTNVYQVTVSQTVNPPTSLTYANAVLTVKQDSSATSAPPTVIGTHPIQYAITTNPTSASKFIVINDSTGAITVDSGVAVGTYTVSVGASNSAGSKLFNNAYVVTVNPVKPYSLVYSPSVMGIVTGTAGIAMVQSIKGTMPVTYSLFNNSYQQINIDSLKGIISVDSGLAVGAYQVDVVATNAAGSVILAYNIVVSAAPMPPSRLVYSTDSLKLTFGQSGSSVVGPNISGTSPIVYSITSSPITTGITIDSATGIITVANNLALGTYTVNIKAANAVGSQVFANAYTIVISATPPSGFSYSTSALTVADDATGTSVSPTISGTGPITYSITASPASAAITINSSSGLISVAEGATLGKYTVTATATNVVGSANTSYTITIIPSYTIDIHPIMKSYCVSCHSEYNTYSATQSDIGSITNRINLPPSNNGFMPRGGKALSAADINLIQLWKSTGTKD